MLTHREKELFFIIAPDRSGTSKLQEIMNTFEGFCNTSESRIAGAESPSCWVSVMRYRDFTYLEEFIEKNWTARYFVEKSPPSINCLPEILDKYPEANFIFLERHPLKILLSQLNLFHGLSDIGTRKHDLGDVILKDEILMIREKFMAKRLLKMILYQTTHKKNFKHSLTVKFEDLIQSPDSQLNLLEQTFGIKANFDRAKASLSKPSYSTTFRYGFTRLSNKEAIDMVKVACRLWNYQFSIDEDPLNKIVQVTVK